MTVVNGGSMTRSGPAEWRPPARRGEPTLRPVSPTGWKRSRRDLAVSKSLEHNRSLKMMMSIEKSPTRRVYDPEGL